MHGLVVLGCGIGRIGNERAQGARFGKRYRSCADKIGIGVEGCQKTRGDGLGIPFGAGYLSSQSHLGPWNGEGGIEHMGRIDKRVAVHDAIAEELGILEARNHVKHALLLSEGEIRLEAYEVIGGALAILRT